MDVQIAPVVRGEFVYRDTLFVDVGGEGRRHPRASVSELKDLLDGKVAKDQTAHFYEAQLIHYALQRSKEKNTAKVRLQQAVSQGKLSVPQHIADMEAQMKKEYAASVKRAKTQAKRAADSNAEQATPKSSKRKNEEAEPESSKRTKVSMNIGDMTINIEQSAAQSSKNSSTSIAPAPKAKAVAKKVNDESTAATSKPKAKSDPKTASAGNTTKTVASMPKQTARKAAPSLPLDSPFYSQVQSGARKKQTARKAAPSLPPDSPFYDQQQSIGFIRPKQTAMKRAPSIPANSPLITNKVQPAQLKKPSKATVKKEPESTVKAEPKAKTTPVKKEPKVKQESPDHPISMEPVRHNVTGVYNISSPQMEGQYPEQAANLRIFLCVDNDTIWGGFDLFPKVGVLRIDQISVDDSVSFGWRARDTLADGRMAFGRGCYGEITLLPGGRIAGAFFNLFAEPVEFQGERRPGPLWCGRSPYSFQQEWEGFVKEAYGD